MGLRYVIGSAEDQAGSITNYCNRVIAAMQTSMNTLESFNDDTELQGKTYDSAKEFAMNVHYVLAKGIIEVCEEVVNQNKKYISKYRSDVATVTVDEDQVNQHINNIQRQRSNAETFNKVDPSPHSQSMIAIFSEMEKQLKDKIQKLYDYDLETRSNYETANNLLDSLGRGFQQLNNHNPFNVSTGTFSTAGMDMSWSKDINDKWAKYEPEESEDYLEQVANDLQDLMKLNPSAALRKIEENPKLFEYLLKTLDKRPEIQEFVLKVFIKNDELYNYLPKKVATKVMQSPIFALFISKLPDSMKYKAFSKATKLSEEGFDCFAFIGYTAGILSKTSYGAKVAEGLKGTLAFFKMNNKIVEFLGKYKMLKYASYAGDLLTITSSAFDEYCDPKSPAYGNASKAGNGGINLFMYNAGILEGFDYGGPVGGVLGLGNTIYKGVTFKIPKIDMGIIHTKSYSKYFGLLGSSKNQKKKQDEFMKEQYKEYDKREKGLKTGDYSEWKIPNSDYTTGVPATSGSPNSNPGQGVNKNNGGNHGGVSLNRAPYDNWGVIK